MDKCILERKITYNESQIVNTNLHFLSLFSLWKKANQKNQKGTVSCNAIMQSMFICCSVKPSKTLFTSSSASWSESDS